MGNPIPGFTNTTPPGQSLLSILRAQPNLWGYSPMITPDQVGYGAGRANPWSGWGNATGQMFLPLGPTPPRSTLIQA
jgi:hypothetical protein